MPDTTQGEVTEAQTIPGRANANSCKRRCAIWKSAAAADGIERHIATIKIPPKVAVPNAQVTLTLIAVAKFTSEEAWKSIIENPGPTVRQWCHALLPTDLHGGIFATHGPRENNGQWLLDETVGGGKAKVAGRLKGSFEALPPVVGLSGKRTNIAGLRWFVQPAQWTNPLP